MTDTCHELIEMVDVLKDKRIKDKDVCTVIPIQKSKQIPYCLDDCWQIHDIITRELDPISDFKEYGYSAEDAYGCTVDYAHRIIPQLHKSDIMQELKEKYPDLLFDISLRHAVE